MFLVIKKSKLILIFTIILGLLTIMYKISTRAIFTFNNNSEMADIIKDIFSSKSKALLEQDEESFEAIYDKNTKFGQWAFEHEVKKMKYLVNWSEKQGVKFTNITPTVVIRRLKGEKDRYSANLICSTEYKYVYLNNPEKINTFKIGTYHVLSITGREETWQINKEWYTDPFADSLNLDNIKVDSIREYISSQGSRDFSGISQRRVNAVNYADKYSGAANEEQYGFTYNKKYRDYNPQGGDCANFASQILFEGGKFRKNRSWNYNATGGTRAWLNAQGFKDYWVGSGRASVIAQGKYDQVYKAAYKLKPGDFIAYEKEGKITHISMVTGADSKGYSLVNCHNSDRHRVPWDLGWSNKGIKFWLVSVHF
jgi:hypothetical protein